MRDHRAPCTHTLTPRGSLGKKEEIRDPGGHGRKQRKKCKSFTHSYETLKTRELLGESLLILLKCHGFCKQPVEIKIITAWLFHLAVVDKIYRALLLVI